MQRLATTALLVALGAAALPAAPGSWQVTSGDVVVVCPMTIGGSFEATTRNVNGRLTTPQNGSTAYGGVLTVDLTTLDTGIGLRNRHMLERYLEVHRGDGFNRAVLSDVTLGEPGIEARGGRTSFTGRLLLHGVTRTIEGEAQISPLADGVRVQAMFPLDLRNFDIAGPRYLGVGVRDGLTVRIAFTARADAGETE